MYRENDTVIAVMGITGSGKSTFISKIVGGDVVPIGHTLKSGMSQLSPRCWK